MLSANLRLIFFPALETSICEAKEDNDPLAKAQLPPTPETNEVKLKGAWKAKMNGNISTLGHIWMSFIGLTFIQSLLHLHVNYSVNSESLKEPEPFVQKHSTSVFGGKFGSRKNGGSRPFAAFPVITPLWTNTSSHPQIHLLTP